MDSTLIYANLTGYLIVAAGGLVLGTIFGSKFTGSFMAMVHGLDTRITAVETAATARAAAPAPASPIAAGTVRHALAIDTHAAAVTKLAGAIEKHAAAIDDHGAATVAAAIEHHQGAPLTDHNAVAAAPAK